MTKVVILGGGMSGLVSAVAMRSTDEITIIEPSTPGGVFSSGGFKYLHFTESTKCMAQLLGLDYYTVPIKGAILLDGKLHQYPEHLRELPKPQANHIMQLHYAKTRRGVDIDRICVPSVMNDPWGPKPAKMVIDTDSLIKSCMGCVTKWVKAAAVSLTDHIVTTSSGSVHEYDYLINTLPLWVLAKFDGFSNHKEAKVFSTEAVANRLTIFKILSSTTRFKSFDYVYTPITEASVIHRVSMNYPTFDAETSSSITQFSDVMKDIRQLFGESALIVGGVTIPGHVYPSANVVDSLSYLPENWLMVGRYAQWDSRCTVDKVYARAAEWSGNHGV